MVQVKMRSQDFPKQGKAGMPSSALTGKVNVARVSTALPAYTAGMASSYREEPPAAGPSKILSSVAMLGSIT